jgi:hypothetical protein
MLIAASPARETIIGNAKLNKSMTFERNPGARKALTSRPQLELRGIRR